MWPLTMTIWTNPDPRRCEPLSYNRYLLWDFFCTRPYTPCITVHVWVRHPVSWIMSSRQIVKWYWVLGQRHTVWIWHKLSSAVQNLLIIIKRVMLITRHKGRSKCSWCVHSLKVKLLLMLVLHWCLVKPIHRWEYIILSDVSGITSWLMHDVGVDISTKMIICIHVFVDFTSAV